MSPTSFQTAPPRVIEVLQELPLLYVLSYQVGGGGFEPPKQFAADLQSVPFGHSGSHPYKPTIGLEPITC